MSQFIASDPDALVKSSMILELRNFVSVPFQPVLNGILRDNGVDQDDPQPWYKMQVILDICSEIQNRVGPNTMFAIGKKAGDLRNLPGDPQNLKDALRALDKAYLGVHQGNFIGHYRLRTLDMDLRKGEFEVDTPYPDEFDRGLIMSIVRRYKPHKAVNIDVQRKKGWLHRVDGGDSTKFIITWDQL